MKILSGLIMATAMLVSMSAFATQIKYSYSGNPFTDPTVAGVDSISGYFIIDSADMVSLVDATISPIAYSFTDGLTTYGSGGIAPTSEIFHRFVTDSLGNIIDWDISLSFESTPTAPGDSFFRSVYLGTSTGLEQDLANYRAESGFDQNVLWNNRGSWTMSPVPVPAAVWLFGSGLLGLIGVARRRS